MPILGVPDSKAKDLPKQMILRHLLKGDDAIISSLEQFHSFLKYIAGHVDGSLRFPQLSKLLRKLTSREIASSRLLQENGATTFIFDETAS